jgi:hypothetical protein
VLILLEGPDGGGKSTLAAAIGQHAEEQGVPTVIRHTGAPDPPRRCPFNEYETELDRGSCAEAHDPHRLLILDRHHAGEQVYGPVFRGRSRLTDNGMYHVELALTAMGCHKLMIVPPVGTVMERLRQREAGDLSEYDKEFLDIHQLDKVMTWYVRHGYAYRYDVLSDGEADLASVMSFTSFKSLVASAIRSASGGTYIGSLAPRLLICGDARGAGRFGRADLVRPFTPTTKGGSSNYLLNAIRSEPALMHRVGIVNVNDPAVDIRELYTTLGWPRAAALGENASATLRHLGIRHEKIPHPSWANRFRHDDLEWYAARLADAAETGRTRRDDVHSRERQRALPRAD